jgi:hypothetical protein
MEGIVYAIPTGMMVNVLWQVGEDRRPLLTLEGRGKLDLLGYVHSPDGVTGITLDIKGKGLYFILFDMEKQ